MYTRVAVQGVFFVLYKNFFVVYSILDEPPLSLSGFSTSAFAHRNPPRSLWLQHIHWMCCLTRRAHITVPPLRDLEGTHGDRVAGDNANAIDFVTIASSLYATSSTRINCYRSLFMSLVRGRKESKLVRSLVLFVKLGFAWLAALRLVLRICTFRL